MSISKKKKNKQVFVLEQIMLAFRENSNVYRNPPILMTKSDARNFI